MDISPSEVEKYLINVKVAVCTGRYQISSRDKNRELYMDYVFSEAKCAEVLMSLTVSDFSDAVQNVHSQYSDEILYIFGKDISLLPKFDGDEEVISLYIKFNKLANQYLIVISFHKQEFPIKYKFK